MLQCKLAGNAMPEMTGNETIGLTPCGKVAVSQHAFPIPIHLGPHGIAAHATYRMQLKWAWPWVRRAWARGARKW